jgi:S-adenosylmethionine hydrolase
MLQQQIELTLKLIHYIFLSRNCKNIIACYDLQFGKETLDVFQVGIVHAKKLCRIDSFDFDLFLLQSKYFVDDLTKNPSINLIFGPKLENKSAHKTVDFYEMQIITLTTDMGVRDHYVAALKGAILKHTPNARIVDVSHTVRPFDVAEAAFYISSCFEDFPEGTVHVIGVDSEPMINFSGSEGSFPSIMKFKGHFFICNDNGFFGSLLQDERPDAFYRIDDVLSRPDLFKFPTKNMLIPSACRLLNGEKIDDFASPFESYKKAFALTAVIEPNLIKGNVIHIDTYGNLITNVHESLFERFGKDTPFTIYYRNKDYHIDEISPTYNAVPNGEKVAIFNNNGLLEIAINRGANMSSGGADKLFGIRVSDVIRIEFTPRGSRNTLESLF